MAPTAPRPQVISVRPVALPAPARGQDLEVRITAPTPGTDLPVIVFAHGFGCDQNMWRLVAPAFERDFRVVLFDHVGAGGSDLSAYDPAKYDSLGGYADDVVELCRDLGIRGGVFVGH